MKKKVFICYARSDREAADRLHAELVSLGVDAFIDYKSTPANQCWDESIPRAIAASDATVILLTRAWRPDQPNDQKPWYAQDEVHWAIDAHRRSEDHRLVVVYQSGFDTAWCPYGLRRVQASVCDLRKPDSSFRADTAANHVMAALAAPVATGVERGSPQPGHVRLAQLRAYRARDRYLDPADDDERWLTATYVAPRPLEGDGPGRFSDLVDHVHPGSKSQVPRWHVTAPSGYGKSIQARWLAWLLANGFEEAPNDDEAVVGEAADEWIAVLGSRLKVRPVGGRARVPIHLENLDLRSELIDQIEAHARFVLGPQGHGLCRRRVESVPSEWEAACDDGDLAPVLILEVAEPDERLFGRIYEWSQLDYLAQVPIIVLSLPGRPSSPSLRGFGSVRIPAGDAQFQAHLVRRHVTRPNHAKKLLDALRVSGLQDAAATPLVLRWIMIAFGLDEARGLMPGSLPALWNRICGQYVRASAHGAERWSAARRAWGLLLYELHPHHSSSIPRRALDRAMERAFYQAGARTFFEGIWGIPGACLDELLSHDRVLTALWDGTYHVASTTACNYLIAEAYASRRTGTSPGHAGGHANSVIATARSARTLGSRWADINFIASLGFEDPLDIVTLNTETTGWNGEVLVAALREWAHAEGVAEGDGRPAIEALERWSERAYDLIEDRRALRAAAAHVHYALTWFGHTPDAAFFGRFRLPEPKPEGEDGWCTVAPKTEDGRIWVGSPLAELDPFFAKGGPWYDERGGDWHAWLVERERRRAVRLRAPCYEIARHPVTFGEYWAFDPGHAPCLPRECGDPMWEDHPVTNVDWWQARLYAAWRGARLPTEAEWEAACRAGARGPYFCAADDILEHAAPDKAALAASIWYGRKCTAPIGDRSSGGRAPNAFGLHDMLGQVWEWTESIFGVVAAADELADDDADRGGAAGGGHPIVPSATPRARVARGGAFDETLLWVRCAARSRARPDEAYRMLGLRLARDLPRAPDPIGSASPSAVRT